MKNFGNIILDKNDNCLICLEKIKVNKNQENLFLYEEILTSNLNKTKYLAILNCGHVYHAFCIHQWEVEKEHLGDFELKCPLCIKSDLLRENEDIKREEYPECFEGLTENKVGLSNNLIEEPLHPISEKEILNKQRLFELDNLLKIIRESLNYRREEYFHQHNE
jgi:hypothetical protein